MGLSVAIGVYALLARRGGRGEGLWGVLLCVQSLGEREDVLRGVVAIGSVRTGTFRVWLCHTLVVVEKRDEISCGGRVVHEEMNEDASQGASRALDFSDPCPW